MIFQVKITPNAHKNEIVGRKEGILNIRIKSVPEKGRANEELVDFLAECLDIAKSKIEIVSGHTSRLKKIRIEGIEKLPF